VTIRINDVPKAVNDSYTTAKNTALTSSVAGNDTPLADGGNTWTMTVPPASGTVVLNTNGTFTYTPATGFTGTVQFTYKVCDVDNDCAPAVATIKINDVPVAVNDSYTTAKNTPVTASVTGNDTTSADGGNTWTKVTGPSHGTVTMTGTGGFTYTPALNYTGTDSFTYKLCDVDNDCSTATVTIRINDVPVAVNDSYTTPKNTALTSSVAGNDTPSADGGNTWTMTVPPASGTVVLNTNGTFTYTPVTGFTGTVQFTYKVCDVDNDCATAIATVKINDVPLAANDNYTTAKNTPLTASVTGNDTPSADGGNTWTVTVPPTSGTVVLNPNGTFTFTPATNPTATVTFTYKVCDVDNDCATAVVTIRINDVPVAVNDTFTTAEDTPVSGTLTGNDTASADGGNVWTKTSNPTNGTAAVNSDGTFTYTPNPNFFGTDTFTYKVCDADGDCSTATVTITITSVDDAPIAVNDAFTTAEDTPVSGSVTGNDTLSGDGGNVWSKVTNPANGTVVFSSNGTFTYTPNANFYGVDSFTYQICDADGDCSIATVTITITPVDEVPLAVNDSYTTPMDTPVVGSAQANDTPSPDGGNIWSVVTGPTAAMGTVSFAPTGTFTFTPTTGFTGTATFTYKVCDIDGDCANATVTIVIAAVCEAGPFTTYTQGGWGATPAGNNPAKLLQNNFAVVYPAGFVQIGTATRFLKFTTSTAIKNFLPAGGTPSTISASATNPTSSSAGVFAGQVLALQLNVDFSEAGIKKRNLKNQVVASGKLAGSTVGQVLALANSVIGGGALPSGLTISELNAIVDAINNNYDNGNCDLHFLTDDPACSAPNAVPVAANDSYTTAEDVAVTGSLAGNDTPSTDGGNVWSLVNAPSHGTVTITAAGSFTYTPAANFSGTDTFDYQVCDTDDDCDSATATITITATDDAPVAVNDSYSTSAGVAVSGNLAANDTPSGDGGNVWTRVTASSNGTATVSSNGTFTFTPASGFAGVTTFTYKVCDADADCSTATVTITVTSVNHAPVAVNDAKSVDEGADATITVLGNDSDPDGDTISVISNTAPAHGTVVRTGNTFLYSAADDYSGTDTFTYTISDGRGATATATVTITITGCIHGSYTTYTQGGWGASPSGGNPGQFLAANFTSVYTAGYVKIGGSKYLKFTTASAIAAFLPAGGTAAKLTANGTNPTTSTGGVFAGQVLALQLSVDFSKAGKTKAGLSLLKVRSGKLAGYTVQQVLDLANKVLGGTTSALPSGVSIADLNDIVDSINRNFDNGTTNNGYLQ
jgi:VCBS repeat-containing protein